MDNANLQLSAGQIHHSLQQCAKALRTHQELLDAYSRACLEPAGGARLAQTFALIEHQLSLHEPYISLSALVESLQQACLNPGHTLAGQILCAALYRGCQNWQGKAFLTPVDLLNSLRLGCQGAAEAAVFGTQRGQVTALCSSIEDDLSRLDTFTAEQVCATALTSAQSYLVDNPDAVSLNASTAGLGLVLAVLSDMCALAEANVGSYVQVVVQMIRDLTAARSHPDTTARQPNQARFEVSLKVVGLASQWDQIRSQLQRACSEVVCWGQIDPFGLGQWSISAHTTSPLALWSLPGVRSLRVTDLNQRRRSFSVEEPGPEVLGNVTLLLPRQRTAVVARPNLQVTAGTEAPSLVEALAQTGAQVLLHPQPADLQWASAAGGLDPAGGFLLVACAAALQDCPQRPAQMVLTAGPAHTLIVCQQLDQWLATLGQHFPRLAALPPNELVDHARKQAQRILENCVELRPGLPHTFAERLEELLQTARGQKDAVLYAVLGTESTSVQNADLEYTLSQYPQVELRLLHGGQRGATHVTLWQGR